jgi:predicted transcriptional regulator
MDSDLIFVLKSEIRFFILISLKNGPKTPTQLTEENKFYITHISTNLKELEEKGLIICINPEKQKNKLFQLTKNGIKLIEEIHKMTKL